ncbi:MAG: hypothetical protein RLZZ272_677 [Actinomycetota bacterium]|jgi:AcrR family transcriptional regulator
MAATDATTLRGDEGPEGRRRLLTAAIEVVREQGGPALRMTDIAARAGVSFSLIAHHFGSREGLVAAAQRTLLEGELVTDLEGAAELFGEATDTASLLDRIHGLTVALMHPVRADVRIGRAAAIGVAQGREDARTLIVEVVTGLLDRASDIVTDGQARGLIRDDLDPRAIATFIQAYALGLVLADLDAERVDDEALVAVIDTAVRAVLSPPDATPDR